MSGETGLTKVAKFLIPHFKVVKSEGGQKTSAMPPDETKPFDWWQNNQYLAVERFRELRWLGLTWGRKKCSLRMEDFYFKPADDMVRVVEDMQKRGLIGPLGPASSILEPGCNLGRNLYYLHRRFGSKVTGIDISEKAIQKAKEQIWKGVAATHTFYVANVFTTDLFDRFPARHFDLVLTRWHLIHVPRSPEKRRTSRN